MLAASAGRLPEELDGWTIEPKWDGVRVIAEVTAQGARLWTRNGNDKGPQFPEIVVALTALAAPDFDPAHTTVVTLPQVAELPRMAFSDDLKRDALKSHLPVMHCRECGAMGCGGTTGTGRCRSSRAVS